MSKRDEIGQMRDVIEMAKEAGLRDWTCNGRYGCLQRLIELVRADEREACAKVCDAWQEWGADGTLLAKAIRARGQA